VKKLAERAGLDATKYAGHSLRAGHATSAAIAGASERSIMNQTGHRSVQTVRRYIRDGSLFRENSAGKLGLWGSCAWYRFDRCFVEAFKLDDAIRDQEGIDSHGSTTGCNAQWDYGHC
jgi:hypothetical protein